MYPVSMRGFAWVKAEAEAEREFDRELERRAYNYETRMCRDYNDETDSDGLYWDEDGYQGG